MSKLLSDLIKLPHGPTFSPQTKLALGYVEQREAFAFLAPQKMRRKRRNQWQQRARGKAIMGNVFETQMRVRIRRQSLKQVVDDHKAHADCLTFDLESATSGDSQTSGNGVPHSFQVERLSSPCSESSHTVFPAINNRPTQQETAFVLKIHQPLTDAARFRLETLGQLDVARAVPTFVYRVFQAQRESACSRHATERSAGLYRLPRLRHNCRVNIPPRGFL
ncbi:hypothetical protein PsorP6_007336 [Peronosclerospora sorghi]|uniref:Uncharacterized protein n=1 Tax=Peronosclerospora sorghi TaxID=230839 RepID=A0ACC0W7I5_9STRA|nr:hypothetical protein PsorP6_007336 [Peronosclerospora sorghi]